jgi:hypothetical protein
MQIEDLHELSRPPQGGAGVVEMGAKPTLARVI